MNKKGAIEGLQALIVPLIAIGIILAVGFLIFAEAKEKVIDITGEATTFANESYSGYTTGTYQGLSNNCMTLSCSEVRNGSNNNLISSTKWNCTVGSGLIMGNVTADALASELNVTYSCTLPTRAYNATSDVQNATQDIPGWLPVIIITVIGALLIGLVTRFRR